MDDGKQGAILLDASCLLTLFACGRLNEICETLSEPIGVLEYVLTQEALFVRDTDPNSGEALKIRVDVGPLVSAGLVRVLLMENPEEKETFVDLATMLDDGEAMTVACAEHRGCCVATDDRKALRVIQDRGVVSATTSLELVKRWAEARYITKDVIRSTLKCMSSGASYWPGERHPLYAWWRDVMTQ